MRFSPLLAGLLLIPACSTPASVAPATPPSVSAPVLPQPTEHVLDHSAEMDNKADRKAWFKERHWAADGDDWKAIERANFNATLLERNATALKASAAPNWIERGSRNQAGRVHVAVHSPDGQDLYVGSSKAGIWRGSVDGTNWTPLADDLYGGAHWVAATPGDSAGAPDILLGSTDSGLVHYSDDDGLTWNPPAGLPNNLNGVRRVAQTTDGSEYVFLLGRASSTNNLYRSADGGRSFTSVLGLGSFQGDLFVPRDGGSELFVATSNGVRRSNDSGTTWQTVGPLPTSGSRAELVASEAGAPRLWLALHGSGSPKLYRSDDAGATWLFREDLDDYWGSLSASILDVGLMAYGGVECWRTTNGGGSYNRVNTWGSYYSDPANRLHADIPGIDVALTSPGNETWYVSTDGGLYRSTNGLSTVQNLSLDGLRISQYYTTHTSRTNPSHVIAGAQDQGYQRSTENGPGTFNFTQVISGDYAHAVSSDGSHDYVYSVYPGFVLIQTGENNPSVSTSTQFPNEDHAWLPPLAPDAGFKESFFLCAENIHRYTKSGGSWIRSQWSTTNLANQGGEYLGGLAFSPVDSDRAYTVTSYGDLYFSDDHGVTWSFGSSQGPDGQYFHGTAIEASSLDVDTAWVGGSGYSNPPVRRTIDGGATWQDWSQGLPSTLVYCLVEAPDGSGTVFCGTEQGAYRRDPGGLWTSIIGAEAPVNTYWSAEAIPSTNTIRFGTYGRGIWDYQITPGVFCAWTPFGEGLGGQNVLSIEPLTSPAIGVEQQFRVSGGGPLKFGLVAYATQSANLPLFGGTVLINVNNFGYAKLVTDGTGSGVAKFTIPNDPAIAGIDLFAQGAIIEPSAPEGWRLSSGLETVICN